jgi:AraC family transcriptional regulator
MRRELRAFRLFLDFIEQALAVALVNGYAVPHRSMQTHRGGLGSARLRRIKEFVDAKIEDELTLCEMAQAVELSTAHFSRMFCKSAGETPHQFLLRQRLPSRRRRLDLAARDHRNTMAACIIIGERAAEELRNEHRLETWSASRSAR